MGGGGVGLGRGVRVYVIEEKIHKKKFGGGGWGGGRGGGVQLVGGSGWM